METTRTKVDRPRSIARLLMIGGTVWAVFLAFIAFVFTLHSFTDSSGHRLTLYLLCGYAVYFWWIYRWRRKPALLTSIIWWLGSIAVNAFWLFIAIHDDTLSFRFGSDPGEWLISAWLVWWIFASALSVIALCYELVLGRMVSDA